MDIPETFDPAAIDALSRPAFSFVTETNFTGETEPHRHRKAQLLYVMSGVLTMRAAGGVWTALVSLVILYVLKATIGLRPSTQEEIEGLDLSQHGEVVP